MKTTEVPRNLFISVPLSLSRAAAAPPPPPPQLAVCKFFGMSARACNNFMEISSPAKYPLARAESSRARATRRESKKRDGREEKKRSPSSFSLHRGRCRLPVQVAVGIEKGNDVRTLIPYSSAVRRADFFFSLPLSAPFSPFFHPRPGLRRVTVRAGMQRSQIVAVMFGCCIDSNQPGNG